MEAQPSSQSTSTAFRPSVYALINLRTRAQRIDDPLAPLASLVCDIIKAYKSSSNLVKTLIQLVYEYGVDKIEKNAEVDHEELSRLNQIESSLSRHEWPNEQHSDDVTNQIQRYITYFTARRRTP
ncbi:hypothetical protein BT96DRAFT_562083 [Gymnopus androsaceus JB14]|uniref:Uncharacterized protein n=1 Tax=Gymnopus androsaceus JB14 TaxID=1447944 RepID=A0A6A4HW96_9AGAR|nr:hypothetical protein BT96DRAFT_562083 [Gymnopus androsaceus JB14]